MFHGFIQKIKSGPVYETRCSVWSMVGVDQDRWKGRRLTSSTDTAVRYYRRSQRSTPDVCRNFTSDAVEHSVSALSVWRHELFSPRSEDSAHYPSNVDCVRVLAGAYSKRCPQLK